MASKRRIPVLKRAWQGCFLYALIAVAIRGFFKDANLNPYLVAVLDYIGTAIVLGTLFGLLWMVYNMIAQIFGKGDIYARHKQYWDWVKVQEKLHGYAPIGCRIGKLCADKYGLFWLRRDGSRERDV